MRSQSSHRHTEKAAEKPTQTVSRLQRAATDTATSSSSPAESMSPDRAESELGVSVPNKQTLFGLQRKKATHPRRFLGWVDEGMTSETMGDPNAIEAFRQRQADRPPEVPTDIERRNKRSVQRSAEAAAETGPAGQTGVPDPVRDVISSTGHSLDGTVQRMMEDRMDSSFDDVQVHTGAKAANACESINARAFTVGNHVAFNQGEYEPDSPEGQHVIAHELAHVRQQTEGAVSMLPQEGPELEVDPDPALEREAEQTAQRVMQGGKLGIQRLDSTNVHIQRMMNPNQQQSGMMAPPGMMTPPEGQVMDRNEEFEAGNEEMYEAYKEVCCGAVDLTEAQMYQLLQKGIGPQPQNQRIFKLLQQWPLISTSLGLKGTYENCQGLRQSCSSPDTTPEEITNRRRKMCWDATCGTIGLVGVAGNIAENDSIGSACSALTVGNMVSAGVQMSNNGTLKNIAGSINEQTNSYIDLLMNSMFGSPENIIQSREAARAAAHMD